MSRELTRAPLLRDRGRAPKIDLGPPCGASMRAQVERVPPSNSSEAETVLLLGGKGGLLPHYREAVEKQGYRLRYFEKRLPANQRRTLGKVAMVVVMVNMMSHALLSQAREAAEQGASVVYLKTASVSALRDALARKDA